MPNILVSPVVAPVPTKPKCSNCNKELETYEVIRYTDAKGWCSFSCKVKWEKKPASSVR